MRNSAKFYFTIVLFSMLLLSCRKEETVSSLPKITLEEVETGITSITFRLTPENASDAAYWVYKSGEAETPQGGDIFSKGTRIPADEETECTVSDLEPNTVFTVAAAAKNADGNFSEVVTIEMSTTPSEGLYSFKVDVVPEDVYVKVKVEPSSDDAYYVLDVVAEGTYTGIPSSEIHADYLRIFEGMASNEERPLEEILAENLENGTFDGQLDGLYPLSSYELVIFGMDPKMGFVTSEVMVVPFQTVEQILTLEVIVENLTAVSADVYVYPSNNDDSFIWLCEPTAKYPDMTLEDIALAYTEANKQWLDQNMGLYHGAQEYPGYELMPGVEYYILAYGYEPGEGMSTDVVGQFFTAPAGGDIEDFSAEIKITKTQGERIDYTVTPNDETIYYLPGCMKTSLYSDDFVKTDVQDYIKAYMEGVLEYNPAYSIEEAVSVLCYMGEQELYASPLESGTEYTVFVVPVNTKGETGSVVVSVATSTTEMGYSDADVTSEYIGAWDGKILQDAGYFQGQNLTDKYIMAFRVNVSQTCETIKVKFWNGATELTDQELIDIIEPYWDAVYEGEDVDNLRYIYTTTPNYWPGSMTLCTLGFNAEGERAAMGRTFVDVFWEDALLPLEDWEALQTSSPAPQMAVAPNGRISDAGEPVSVKAVYSPKTLKK